MMTARGGLWVAVLSAFLLGMFAPGRTSAARGEWMEKSAWLVTDLGGGDARLNRVLAADVDSDGTEEVVVVGHATLGGTGRDAYVGIYHLSGTAWVKETEYWKDFGGGDDTLNGVVVLDCDSDGTQEIIVTGTAMDAQDADSQEDIVVGILYVAGGNITEETGWYVKEFAGSAARRNWGLDIAAGNVDGDAATELVVVSRDDFGVYVNTPLRVGVLSVSAAVITLIPRPVYCTTSTPSCATVCGAIQTTTLWRTTSRRVLTTLVRSGVPTSVWLPGLWWSKTLISRTRPWMARRASLPTGATNWPLLTIISSRSLISIPLL